ncbi:MAG TPA: glycosyl hydrolase 115 family protein [Verrucomicrobiae bacterium]
MLTVFLLTGRNCFALGQIQYVDTSSSAGAFPVVQNQAAANLLVDTNDFTGVLIAAGNLQMDISRVSSVMPQTVHDSASAGPNAIIIGSIGHSALIDQLIQSGKIDVSGISNKWESFFLQTVSNPLPGIQNALVICGSDKRGTIYGIYDLSEEIGVSPWYFWTDTAPKHHDALFVRAGKYLQGPPAVKYRGIFLNDEAPDLTGWVNEKYGGYNHGFYTNVFEVLLRLKANYLWPAMWNNAFGEDDPLNAKLANDYGIVMGTSHVEPMMRADKEWSRAGFAANEWNFLTHSNDLKTFWREGLERNKDYESIITDAMRGKIDTPMTATANVALLEEIVASQREIIGDVMHTNVADVPQLWALYKEVLQYYELGMRVPDDITLLWCDDNWGDIRRLPTGDVQNRSGGSGIYYHFDYVGGPRNYKWINAVQNEKTWEQMDLAHNYAANQIWIVNVGHFQHVTFPTEFFLSMAWNPDRWGKDHVSEFTKLWAQREFGDEYAAQIADVMERYTKYAARRKPELLAPDTYSIVDYSEADNVLNDWKKLRADAEAISNKLPADERDSFFETVLYPVKASAIVNEMYIDAAKNHLYSAQGRASANDYADHVAKLFQADADLSGYYNNTLHDGKWSHMMDQTHIGYYSWQQPQENTIPEVTTNAIPTNAVMGIALSGSEDTWPGASNAPVLNLDKFSESWVVAPPYIDIFNKGRTPFKFTAKSSAPWLLLLTNGSSLESSAEGMVSKDLRLWVNVNQLIAPAGATNETITISNGTNTNNTISVRVNIFNPVIPSRNLYTGFVEADGYVSMEADHFTTNVPADNAHWDVIPNLGRTGSAMSIFPVTASSVTPPEGSPHLDYEMYLFDTGTIHVETLISPTLNFVSGRGLRFALSLDDGAPQIVTAVPANYSVGDGNHDWEETARDNVRKITTDLKTTYAGKHTLKVWMVDPGVVLQKIVVNCGGEKESYLGPPESYRQ